MTISKNTYVLSLDTAMQ